MHFQLLLGILSTHDQTNGLVPMEIGEGNVMSSGSLTADNKHLQTLDSLLDNLFSVEFLLKFNLFNFSTELNKFPTTVFFFNADGGVFESLLVRSIESICCLKVNKASFRKATAAEHFLKQTSQSFKPTITWTLWIFTPKNHQKKFSKCFTHHREFVIKETSLCMVRHNY